MWASNDSASPSQLLPIGASMREPRGVAQQVPQCDPRLRAVLEDALDGEVRQVRGDRLVEIEEAVLHREQHRSRREGLGRRLQAEEGVRGDRCRRVAIGDPEPFRPHDAVVIDNRDRQPGDSLLLHQMRDLSAVVIDDRIGRIRPGGHPSRRRLHRLGAATAEHDSHAQHGDRSYAACHLLLPAPAPMPRRQQQHAPRRLTLAGPNVTSSGCRYSRSETIGPTLGRTGLNVERWR